MIPIINLVISTIGIVLGSITIIATVIGLFIPKRSLFNNRIIDIIWLVIVTLSVTFLIFYIK